MAFLHSSSFSADDLNQSCSKPQLSFSTDDLSLQFPRFIQGREYNAEIKKAADKLLDELQNENQKHKNDILNLSMEKGRKIEAISDYFNTQIRDIDDQSQQVLILQQDVRNWAAVEISKVRSLYKSPELLTELSPGTLNRVPEKQLPHLYHYQIESINRMMLIQQYFSDNQVRYLGNIAGSGKTRVALTYALLQKDVVVIVVPNNMYDHWVQECQHVDIKINKDVFCYRDVRGFKKALTSSAVPKIHIIGANCYHRSSSLMNELLTTHFPKTHRQYIFDEIQTFESCSKDEGEVARRSVWIITASFESHHPYKNQINDYGGDFVVKAHADFINTSYQLPDPIYHPLVCKGLQAIIRQFLPEEVLDLINQGDLSGAIKKAGGSTTHSDVVQAHTHKLTKQIENFTKEIRSYYNFIDFMKPACTRANNNIDDDVVDDDDDMSLNFSGGEAEDQNQEVDVEDVEDVVMQDVGNQDDNEDEDDEKKEQAKAQRRLNKMAKINAKIDSLVESEQVNNYFASEEELQIGLGVLTKQKDDLLQKRKATSLQLEQMKERMNEALCPICYTDNDDVAVTITRCCSIKLCFQCLIASLKEKKICPWCRARMSGSEAFDVVTSLQTNEQVELQIEDTRNKTKEEVLLDLLCKEPNEGWVVVSENENSFKIHEVLKQKKIHAEVLKGSSGHVRNLIQRHKQKEFPILFLNRKIAGTGIHLAHATRMVFYHKFATKYDYLQAIARCQRMGRDQNAPLHIYYLLCNDETAVML